MSTTVTTTLFLAKERPLVTRARDGAFALSLLTMDALDNGQREPWRLIWTGPEAEAWYAANADHLKAGQPLQVRATRIRAHTTVRAAEIHARVLSLAIGQPRWQTKTEPEHAAA